MGSYVQNFVDESNRKYEVDKEGNRFTYEEGESGGLVKIKIEKKSSKIQKSKQQFNTFKLQLKEGEAMQDDKIDENQSIESKNDEKIEELRFQKSEILTEKIIDEFKQKERLFESISDLRGPSLSKDIKIRGWVDNCISDSLDKKCLIFINKLNLNQILKKIENPRKAKKRLVSGFNQVKRKVHSQVKKEVKLLIVAVNIQENPLDFGSDQEIFNILNSARSRGIPYVFSGTRNEFGLALYGKRMKKKQRATVIAVLNFEGYNKVR